MTPLVRNIAVALVLLSIPAIPFAVNLRAALERSKQRETMFIMRDIGARLEHYASIHPGLPLPAPAPADEVDDGLRLLPWTHARPRPLSSILPQLDLAQFGPLPLADAWGSPLYYDSDGTHYAVLAPASGGSLEPWSWSRGGRGLTRSEDLIFADGGFFKY